MGVQQALIDLRKQKGLTQDEMADKLFVTRQAVSRWENGNTTPSVETLKLIAKELDAPLNALLGSDDELVCQSCAMPLRAPDDLGTNADGGVNSEYCTHCFQEGAYTNDRSLDEMVEANLRFLGEFNQENGLSYSEEEARSVLKSHLATLKRWKR